MKKKYYWIVGIVGIILVFIAIYYLVGFEPSYHNPDYPNCGGISIECAKAAGCEEYIRQNPTCSDWNSINVKLYGQTMSFRDFLMNKNTFACTDENCAKIICGCPEYDKGVSNSSYQTGINESYINSYYQTGGQKERGFNIMVDPITSNISAGEYFEYNVTIYGLNNSTKNVNTSINYTITSVTNGDLIAENSEWIIINRSLSFNRKLLIPSNTTAGLYTIEAKAYYNNSLAASVRSFNVT